MSEISPPVSSESEKTILYANAVSSAEAAGLLIAGKYRLREQIGEGGMGSVWKADQIGPVKRLVAVKLIRIDRGTSGAILSRFEAERQAIALMDHPHIAKLFDAGTTGESSGADDSQPATTGAGQPFFVMELVNGTPLTEFCDRHRLSVPDRLRLFVQICGAVQHAHQKGIIHRDLKPTNILVELHDDKPMPKVIDFGLAKACGEQTLTEDSLLTGYGTVAGTPLYMAPEQATFNAIDVDTRADIYALGVILYELLTGSTPIERASFKKAAFEEMLRMIRESEPPIPSKRLSTADSTPSVAANRQIEPQRLGRFVRGELDWIVMKSLAKERDRRYETASGFARDIERFLNHEPVQAGPPSARYRFRKFVRRNRGQVVAASLIVLALTAGIIGTSVGLIRADRQRQLAEGNEQKAIKSANAERSAKYRETEQRRKAQAARDRTRQALDAMTSTVTGDSLSAQTSLSEDQKRFLTEVLTYYREFASEEADDEKGRARTAEAAFRVGTIEYRLGRTEKAVVALQMAQEGFATLAADFAAEPEYRLRLSKTHGNLGLLLNVLGKRIEAEGEYRQAVAIGEKLCADFPKVPACRETLAENYSRLAINLNDLGRRTDAEATFRRAIAMFERLREEFPEIPDLGRGLSLNYHNLGMLLVDLGNWPEAEEHYSTGAAILEPLVTAFPRVSIYKPPLAQIYGALGSLLARMGKRSDAELQIRQGLKIWEKLVADFPSVPEFHRGLSTSHINLGVLLADLGKRPDAERQYRQALAILQVLVADFPNEPGYRDDFGSLHKNLGYLLGAEGKVAEAEKVFRQGVEIQAKLVADFPSVSKNRYQLAASHNNLANLLTGLGRDEEAKAEYRKALDINEKLVAEFPTEPAYLSELASNCNNIGNLLSQTNPREAEDSYRRALAIAEQLVANFPKVSEYSALLGGGYCNLGNVTRESKRLNDSLELFEKAILTLKVVLEQDQQSVMANQFLRNSFAGRAKTHSALQKHAEASLDWDQAVRLTPIADQPRIRVVKAFASFLAGSIAEAVAEVEELSKLSVWNVEVWYNFACVFAVASAKIADKQQEYADRAMEMLHKAIKAGYNDAAHMAKDADLDALRDRRDFQKLLLDLRAKATK